MTKRASLFAAPVPASAPSAIAPATSAEPDARSRPAVAPSRAGKRNGTVYLEPEAFRQLKRIAADEDTTMQDLLLEGVNHVFAKRGLSRIA